MSGKKPDKNKQQPLLDRTKANDLNLTVLRRIDSNIEEVLASASAVCLYRMSLEDQQWQRKNIEGSLFLIKRRTQPRFQMLVLNKLSTDNYVENVHGGLEMESNPPYLMYTHGNDEIHGIWFYDEVELQRVAALLQKILNQLPKPEAAAGVTAAAAALSAPQQQTHYQPSPAPAIQQHAEAAVDAAAADGGDGFWDKSVHVTPETLPSTQQLVLNSSLLAPEAAAGPSGTTPPAVGGLHGLLKAAQQRATGAQRTPTPAAPQQAAAPSPVAAAHVPNNTPPSAPAEPPPAAVAPGLLTPAFFEQQKAKQPPVQPAAVQAAAAGGSSTPVAVPQPAAPVAPAGLPAAGSPATNGATNALHQLLSRAAKVTPGPTTAATKSGSGGGAARALPQPPIGVLSPEAVREKLKAALIRLANNDAFVDILAQELRTVGLLQ